MRIGVRWLFFILFIAAPVLAASGPWKHKPYTTWTAKDVRKILWNSPGAKVIRTPYYPEQESGGPHQITQTIGSAGNPPRDRKTIALPTPDQAPYRPEGVYVVRWASSQTIQHAVLRDHELNGGEAADKETPADGPDDEYEFVLVAESPSKLPWMDHDAVRESALLWSIGSKKEVSPAHIEITRDPKVGTNSRVILYFPKRTQSGQPLIGPGETSVEFYVKLGPRTLQTRFNLSDIVGPNGPDYSF